MFRPPKHNLTDMHEISFEETLEIIKASDPRYHREAYLFVRDALETTKRRIGKEGRSPEGHVSAGELLEGIRQHAITQFGPMAITVLEEWGVRSCGDFGNIVFNLIEAGWFAKSTEDRREDFDAGYDFFDAFRKPYLPSRPQAVPMPATTDS